MLHQRIPAHLMLHHVAPLIENFTISQRIGQYCHSRSQHDDLAALYI
jgi:hypothetical protein